MMLVLYLASLIRSLLALHDLIDNKSQRMMFDKQAAELKSQVDILLARLDRETRIEVAEISAQTTLDAADISAAKQASAE